MDSDMVGHPLRKLVACHVIVTFNAKAFVAPFYDYSLFMLCSTQQSRVVRPYNSDVGQTPPVSPSAPSAAACRAFYQCDKIRQRWEWRGI